MKKIIIGAIIIMVVITGINLLIYFIPNTEQTENTVDSLEIAALKDLILNSTLGDDCTLIYENNEGIRYTMEWKLSDGQNIARFTGENKTPSNENADMYFDLDNGIVYDIQNNYIVVIDYKTADAEIYKRLIDWYCNNTAIHVDFASTDLQVTTVSDHETCIEVKSAYSGMEETTYTETESGWLVSHKPDEKFNYKHTYNVYTDKSGRLTSIKHTVERSEKDKGDFEVYYTETNYLESSISVDFNIEDVITGKELIDYSTVNNYNIYSHLSR